MNYYRVTKYNPVFRNADGHYLKNEWTCVSEIGLSFENEILTPEAYLKVENSYVSAIKYFMDTIGISSFEIRRLEKYGPFENGYQINSQDSSWQVKLENLENVSGSYLERIVRSNLRNEIWCILSGSDGSFVRFGHDYYMYMGTSKILDVEEFHNEVEGVFIENWFDMWSNDDAGNEGEDK